MNVCLTPQQQAIVEHVQGPALVYAVAGAGKTTAVVHRISHLVNERACRPDQILAATFNKSAQLDLERRVQAQPGCGSVRPMTLHALGYRILNETQRAELLPQPLPQARDAIDDADKRILAQAMATARSRNAHYRDELEHLDTEDFLNYIGACKGSLQYADLDAANLPESALEIAGQAPSPPHNSWYLDLYSLFESTRQQSHVITFDDMLMSGWEALMRFPQIRSLFQSRYRYVMVDEYQDLNLAQAEILDILTEPHRNYMAIGDDDQTIYSWRGASADYMLDFERRYGARRYFMTENFRCQAGQIALANAVIAKKRRGMRKRLQLTQGFDGLTEVKPVDSDRAMATDIVRTIQRAQRKGVRLDDISVLVRIYAQTGPIEDALITAGIPYVVVGALPFYLRAEVQTLLDYWQLARLNAHIQAQQPLDSEQQEWFSRAWRQVYWQPKRYLPRTAAAAIEQTVLARGVPLSAAISGVADQLNSRQNQALRDLCATLDWLAEVAGPDSQKPRRAVQVLADLERRLDYKEFLRNRSEFSGAEQADNVDAFISYARNYRTMDELADHLRELREDAGATRTEADNVVRISSIHRAKGKEWTVVFVPGCNNGMLPSARAADEDEIEEERRLLYVAITRARETLVLYARRDLEPSRFLQEADYAKTLSKCNRLCALMQSQPEHWELSRDAAALVAYSHELGFGSYFSEWWRAEASLRQSIGRVAASFVLIAQDAPRSYPYRPNGEDRALWNRLAGPAFEPIPMSLPQPAPAKAPPIARPAVKPEPKPAAKPAKKVAKKTPAKPSKPSNIVIHLMLGRGRIVKELTRGGKAWLQIKFGKDILEFRADDPNLRRQR